MKTIIITFFTLIFTSCQSYKEEVTFKLSNEDLVLKVELKNNTNEKISVHLSPPNFELSSPNGEKFIAYELEPALYNYDSRKLLKGESYEFEVNLNQICPLMCYDLPENKQNTKIINYSITAIKKIYKIEKNEKYKRYSIQSNSISFPFYFYISNSGVIYNNKKLNRK